MLINTVNLSWTFQDRQVGESFRPTRPAKGVLGEKGFFPYRRKLLPCGRKKNTKKEPSGFLFRERTPSNDRSIATGLLGHTEAGATGEVVHMDNDHRMTITVVAEKVGVTPKTITRWEKARKVKRAKRDWKGWRIYSQADLGELIKFHDSVYY